MVRSGQRVFHEVIERYLSRITYEGGWAARLILPITEEPLIVVDPERAFGQPIFTTVELAWQTCALHRQ